MQINNSLFEREKKWLLNEKYSGIESPEYFVDVELLASGHPLDYLIGSREFLGCHIDLSEHPLIPRNETEYWLHDIIESHRGPTPALDLGVLDIFSGSGCIGIAYLRNLPQCTVDFVEKNPAFVKQIQTNLDLNQVDPTRYTVYESDVFSALPSERQYDLILANPPYIAHDRRETVQDSVHEHEDYNSLYANDDGLYFVKQLIDNAQKYLKPSGSMYIEYDPWQTNAIIEYIKSNHPALSHQIIKDQFGRERVIKINSK